MSQKCSKSFRLVSRLSVDTAVGAFLGDTRIRLLEAVGRFGSISRAAKAVPMSYKAAWDAVDAMNNLSEAPLVTTSVGGVGGGGAELTAYGARLIAIYRAVEQEYQEAMERLSREVDSMEATDLRQCRRLLRRLAIRTSARNQFVGKVEWLEQTQVRADVGLDVGEGLTLAAAITRESAEELALAVGVEVHAFVKASSVLIATDRRLRTSARNQLWGRVKRVHADGLSADVVLDIPGGRTVTALVTGESADRMGLTVGSSACALFEATSVILAAFAA